MPSLDFKNTLIGNVGATGIHLTVYAEDENGDFFALDPTAHPVNWSNLQDTITVESDESGYLFTSSVPGFCVARADYNGATAPFVLNFRKGSLKFGGEASSTIISTSISFSFSITDFHSPIPSGALIGIFTVEPANWVGSISLTGDDVEFFVVTDTVESDGPVQFILLSATTVDVARAYQVVATARP